MNNNIFGEDFHEYMTEHKFLSTHDYDVFTFGRPPVSIEILTLVKGLTFKEAILNAQYFEIENQEQIRVLSLDDLIKAKKAAGRARDLDDIEHLEG